MHEIDLFYFLVIYIFFVINIICNAYNNLYVYNFKHVSIKNLKNKILPIDRNVEVLYLWDGNSRLMFALN